MLRDASSDYDACSASADAQTASIDAMTAQLGPWKPSPYWDPESLRSVVLKAQAMISQAFDMVAQAEQSCTTNIACPSGSFDLLLGRHNDLLDVTTQSQNYLAACDAAEQSAAAALSTVYVQATAVKQWASDTLVAVSNAMHAAIVVSCMRPWWAAAWAALVSLATDFANFCVTALGVAEDVAKAAIAAGQATYQVAKQSFRLLLWLGENAWLVAGGALAAVGGLFAYRNRDRIRAALHRGSP